MTTPTPNEKLHYGKAFSDALHTRLQRHFTSLGTGKSEVPLTIGLFGSWGSGKSLQLEYLKTRLLSAPVEPAQNSFTFPVLFNAWRHETEDHLIVPLLKTTHYALESWLKEQQSAQSKLKDTLETGLKSSAVKLKDAALALAAGLKGKLSVPLIGEIEVNPAAMLDEDANRRTARRPGSPHVRFFKRKFNRSAPPPNRLDQLDAIYHDFETHLRHLTGVGSTGVRLNLLFLIDDLDRCLPEKAVQMLESIKLFMDVPGCAFVLALDDEIVERGIAHRYRDYWQASSNPISGHEYLEKMVHLPVHVPRPTRDEIHSYLQTRYADLFDALPPQWESGPRNRDAPAQDRNAAENTIRAQLLDLIKRAVPANPRKLNRVAELYSFWLEVAEQNQWTITAATQRLTLLRLAILQLLAPELYRFGQQQTAIFAKLEIWLKENENAARVRGTLEKKLQDQRDKYQNDPLNLGQIERLDEPLLTCLRAAQTQRSRFDPLDLLDPSVPCEPLPDYYRLGQDHTTLAASAAVLAQVSAQPGVARLADPREFVEQLLSADALAWRTALEQDATNLAGRVLDESSFNALLAGIKLNPEHVTLAWLEPLAPHLTTDQLYKLYQASKLLTRLNTAVQETSP